MKFEIDPNELTAEQRTHVAAFITNWPRDMYGKPPGDTVLKRGEPFEQHAAVKYEHVTEEQRLDSEQKSDMGTTGELREISGAAQADNLNAIFGTPTATDRLELGAKIDNLVPLDKEGLPWDSRIHSSSKATIADGSWKLRRGVDPTEVEKVKAQLKELMAVPKFTDLTSELLNVAFNTPNADNEVAQALVDAARVPVPPAPVIVGMGTDTSVITQIPPAPKSHYLIDQDPTVAANQQPTPVTLTDLIGRMSKAIAEGRLSQANVTEICVKYGVSEFHLLSNRPDLLPLIDADMKAMGV